MTDLLQNLAKGVHAALARDAGPDGRLAAADALAEALANPEFVASYNGPEFTEKAVELYRNEDLDFRILAHYHRPDTWGPPHDHGDSWAIYGSGTGTTVMTEWKEVEKEGDVSLVIVDHRYEMPPGTVQVYNEGVIHSTGRIGETRVVRITGTDLSNIVRGKYRPTEPSKPADL